MHTRLASTVLVFLLLHGAAAAQAPPAATQCQLFGEHFFEAAHSRESGLTFKESLELIAQAHQRMTERGTTPPAEAQALVTLTIKITTLVYFHPLYRVVGPEMNRYQVQTRCQKLGVGKFYTELETEWQTVRSHK